MITTILSPDTLLMMKITNTATREKVKYLEQYCSKIDKCSVFTGWLGENGPKETWPSLMIANLCASPWEQTAVGILYNSWQGRIHWDPPVTFKM